MANVLLDSAILSNLRSHLGSILCNEALEICYPTAKAEFDKRTAAGDHCDFESILQEAIRALYAKAHKAGVKPEGWQGYCRQELADSGDSLLKRIFSKKREAQAAVAEAEALEAQGLQARSDLSQALAKKEHLESDLAQLQDRVAEYSDEAIERSLKAAADIVLVRERSPRNASIFDSAVSHFANAEANRRVLAFAIEAKREAIAKTDEAIASLKRTVKSLGK